MSSMWNGVSPGKAAVMQICGETDHCHVLHIFHSGIPQSLRFLLEDPTLLKVGVGIANDAVKVFKDHNVSIKSLEDLSCLANRKLAGGPQKWGLESLTRKLISKEVLEGLPDPEVAACQGSETLEGVASE
uniref:3'-5' exonuclease n=1 Tax=Fagus sylvatica TaxID=28930 RepID=A0A2N9F9Z2_FAGSY